MYTINQYRSSSPIYHIPRGAALECGRENIIRALEGAPLARSRAMQALQQLGCRLRPIIGVRRGLGRAYPNGVREAGPVDRDQGKNQESPSKPSGLSQRLPRAQSISGSVGTSMPTREKPVTRALITAATLASFVTLPCGRPGIPDRRNVEVRERDGHRGCVGKGEQTLW